LLVGWDERAHDPEQFVGEEGVEGAVVDAEGCALEHLDRAESGLFEVVDEGTLRQGAGCSAGPGGWMGQYFGWEFVLVNGEVGEAELAAGSEDARAFGEHSRFTG
jgi:hypothetical protein